MTFAIYHTPIGYIRIEHKGCTLSRLQILGSVEPLEYGETDSFSDMVFSQVMEYLGGQRQAFDIKVDISTCTPFQVLVLKELLKIPYSEFRSYKDVAIAIGRAKAYRAVGAACNHNPIHIIIPCHRVVGARGALTGYAAGVDVKQRLLDLET